jgi:hypothetical protein
MFPPDRAVTIKDKKSKNDNYSNPIYSAMEHTKNHDMDYRYCSCNHKGI